jgi:hypothetical protein
MRVRSKVAYTILQAHLGEIMACKYRPRPNTRRCATFTTVHMLQGLNPMITASMKPRALQSGIRFRRHIRADAEPYPPDGLLPPPWPWDLEVVLASSAGNASTMLIGFRYVGRASIG